MYTGKTHTVYGIAYFNDVIYSSIFYENEDDAEQFVNDGIGEKIIKSCELTEKEESIKARIPDSEVINHTNIYLKKNHNSKKITELNKLEKIILIKHLSLKTQATARQIASITQENYRWVLTLCKSNPDKLSEED